MKVSVGLPCPRGAGGLKTTSAALAEVRLGGLGFEALGPVPSTIPMPDLVAWCLCRCGDQVAGADGWAGQEAVAAEESWSIKKEFGVRYEPRRKWLTTPTLVGRVTFLRDFLLRQCLQLR